MELKRKEKGFSRKIDWSDHSLWWCDSGSRVPQIQGISLFALPSTAYNASRDIWSLWYSCALDRDRGQLPENIVGAQGLMLRSYVRSRALLMSCKRRGVGEKDEIGSWGLQFRRSCQPRWSCQGNFQNTCYFLLFFIIWRTTPFKNGCRICGGCGPTKKWTSGAHRGTNIGISSVSK